MEFESEILSTIPVLKEYLSQYKNKLLAIKSGDYLCKCQKHIINIMWSKTIIKTDHKWKINYAKIVWDIVFVKDNNIMRGKNYSTKEFPTEISGIHKTAETTMFHASLVDYDEKELNEVPKYNFICADIINNKIVKFPSNMTKSLNSNNLAMLDCINFSEIDFIIYMLEQHEVEEKNTTNDVVLTIQ